MTWIAADDVAAAAGLAPVAAVDVAYLAACTDAAEDFARKRRAAAGYADDPDTVPSPSVKLGTVVYALYLYRSRGAMSGSAVYDDLAAAPGSSAYVPPEVIRLLGIPRAGFG